MEIKQPWLTVDCVCFDVDGKLLLIQRKKPPFQGQYALPGGFVDIGETTEKAALRELKEETNISGSSLTLIGVYSDPNRDPRHHVVSIAYLVTTNVSNSTAGDDAATAEFVSDWKNLDLAFDHNQILSDALNLAKK